MPNSNRTCDTAAWPINRPTMSSGVTSRSDGNEHRNEDEGDAVDERKCSDNSALARVHRPRATLACFSDELIGKQHYWASSA